MGNLIIKRRQAAERDASIQREADKRSRRKLSDSALSGLSEEQIEELLELLKHKDALVKIAKGEFEIEKIIEEDDDSDDDTVEEVVEGDDSIEVDENFDLDSSIEEDEEDFDLEDGGSRLNDSDAVNEAWRKRLSMDDK